MLADVPHGEVIVETRERAPSFYVTESRDLGTEILDLGEYQICVEAD